MSAFVLPVYSLWLRDMRHFVRRRSRVVGAIGQPVVIWALLAAGFAGSVDGRHTGGAEYGAFFFPGVLLLITVFTSMFSTMSVIEDRKSGFMQGVLASPASRSALLWGKMLAGSTLSLIQAAVLFALLPVAGITVSFGAAAASALLLAVTGLVLTSFGLLISWRMQSTQGFHAVMNLVLMPMWVLSGALFPIGGASDWLAVVIRLNPMYYVTSLFQTAFFSGTDVAVAGSPDVMTASIIALLSGAAVYAVTLRTLSIR
jgi:ABC-2 type transport system permease protein